MNTPSYGCLEFRREVLADPKRTSRLAAAHLAHCPMCQAYARRIDSMEHAISAALNVPVPEGLAERAILRAVTGRKTRPIWQRTWAIAASLLLSLAIGMKVFFAYQNTPPVSLAQAAVEHADSEFFERLTHSSEKPERFGAILASFGGTLEAPVGDIQYIHFCPIKDHGMGWHIVFQTPHGKVTLLLVPSKDRQEPASQILEVDGKKVRVQRAGQGYYAIIADTQPALDDAYRALKTKVIWL